LFLVKLWLNSGAAEAPRGSEEQPAVKRSAQNLSMLSRAGERCCRQVAEGIDGNLRAALNAHVILRELCTCGRFAFAQSGNML
jgi:hypothetical protein